MEERELLNRKMKILVTVDGSDNSKRALKEAKDYAQAMNAEITILTVLEQLSPRHYSRSGKERAHLHEERDKKANEILEIAASYFEDYKGTVHPLLKSGDPANQILEVVDSKDFNLIVMGNRGLGAFSRTFLGSVSNKVLNHSDTNVLIVR